jgi:hypothetical protein
MHRMQAHKRGRGYVPAMTGQNARNSLLVVQQWPTIV